MIEEKKQKPFWKILLTAVWQTTVLFALFVWAVLTLMLPQYALDKAEALIEWGIANKQYQTWIIAAFIATGITLYVLRTHRRALYGIFECLVAVSTISYSVTQASTPRAAVFGVVTGVYIIVRGLDNLFVGWKEMKIIEKSATERKDQQV